MDDGTRWIELDGAVNARDLGGLPTADGRTTRRARVLRSDNLQNLSVADVRLLLDDYDLSNVIDLRSDAEVRLEGPGPLTRVPSVTVHRLSVSPEGGRHTDVAADTGSTGTVDVDRALPWQERPTDGPGPHRRRLRLHPGRRRGYARSDWLEAVLRNSQGRRLYIVS